MSILGTSLMQYSSRIEPVVVSALERRRSALPRRYRSESAMPSPKG